MNFLRINRFMMMCHDKFITGCSITCPAASNFPPSRYDCVLKEKHIQKPFLHPIHGHEDNITKRCWHHSVAISPQPQSGWWFTVAQAYVLPAGYLRVNTSFSCHVSTNVCQIKKVGERGGRSDRAVYPAEAEHFKQKHLTHSSHISCPKAGAQLVNNPGLIKVYSEWVNSRLRHCAGLI